MLNAYKTPKLIQQHIQTILINKILIAWEMRPEEKYVFLVVTYYGMQIWISSW